MVGDTTYDLEMAKNAGVKGIGVSWGITLLTVSGSGLWWFILWMHSVGHWVYT